MSTQVLTELPRIQQAGMDFDTVMAEIRDILVNHPNWAENWPEFYDSEAGVMLSQLMAWVMDNMSTKQDVLLNEMFLSTAQDDTNKLRLLKQIAYNPRLASSAKVAIRIDFDTMPETYTYITPPRTTLTNRINEIPKFTSKDINGGSITWEILPIEDGKPNYLDSIIIKPGEITYEVDKNNNTLYALQGETKSASFITETANGPYFDLDDKNIAADSIQVYISKTLQQLIEVSSFVNKDALDITQPYPYVVETNEDRTLRIRFGNSSILANDRLLPAGTAITVFYRTTKGSVGNINPGFINASIDFKDDNGKNHSATISNDLLASGGTDEEDIDDAVLNGPLSLRTMDRAVTPQDYNIILDRNPNVFKSKTYTATNQPDGFINYYGRYINPQEAFSFVLLNKNYKDVPKSEYNNFPWITLTKEPRLNEKYIFDKGDYDSSCKYSNTYYNMSMILKDASVKTFKNATIFTLSDDFNNALFDANGNENEILKLKLSTKKTEASFFDDIKFDLLYPNDYAKSTNAQVTMKNFFLSADDNAKFISQTTVDAAAAVDVNNARFITVSFDNKKPIIIDLWVERGTGENGEFPNTEYYLLWTNNGDENARAVWGTNKTTTAALHRNGIVEIINQSLAQLETGANQEFEEYASNTSYQYFNLNMTSELSPITTLQEDAYELTLSVNNETYKFNLSNANWITCWNTMNAGLSVPTSYNWKCTKGLAVMLNWVFSENGGDLKILNKSTNTWEDVVGAPLSYLEAESVQVLTFDTDSDNDNDTEFESVYNSYDLVVKSKESTALIDKNYTDSNGFSHKLKSVIWLDDSYYTGMGMFIHTLKGNSNDATPARDLIPEPTQGADYKNLASFELPSDEDTNGWFILKSPITGQASSISFKYSNAYGTDFMKSVLGLYFNNNGYSYKAYGVKKIYFVKSDTLRNYVTQNGVENTIDQKISAGNIIFENSCIYNNHDFTNVFANFKISESSRVALGSVYENFYYSGNAAIDELLKKNIVGIYGQYMGYTTLKNGVKSYYIDRNKTDLNIKFSTTKQNTNSLYAIKSDLNVIKSDRIKILTACITNPIPGALTIQIDNFHQFSVNLEMCNNGKDIAAAILRELKNNGNIELIQNANTICRDSYTCLNQIQLQNLNKENGSFSFIYTSGLEEETNKEIYKQFLGTNRTNSELYTLYPPEAFNSDNVNYISDDEYFYAPTVDSPLTFKYRKLVEVVEQDEDGTTNVSLVSRPADYYITIEETKNGDQMSYRFILNKTENSKFPDVFFYVHFINDKTYDYDSNGKVIETDETVMQSYMEKYKISGTDITFVSPYFRTYDIVATIRYNGNFSEAKIVQDVNDAVDKICDIEKAEIAGTMSRAKILKAIMNVDGVEDCKINFFGYDYENKSENVDTLTADFYEILCLNDSNGATTGKIFTFEVMN